MRRESYPAAPPVGWHPSRAAIEARDLFFALRNKMIQAGGAQRAVDAAKGGPVGHGK